MHLKSKADVGPGQTRQTKVKFGNVSVVGPAPSKRSIALQVSRSSEALTKIAKILAKPGLSLRSRKDVPLYSVDDTDSSVLVRELNGRVERGRMIDGVFTVQD
jgi:hypothetical protein